MSRAERKAKRHQALSQRPKVVNGIDDAALLVSLRRRWDTLLQEVAAGHDALANVAIETDTRQMERELGRLEGACETVGALCTELAQAMEDRKGIRKAAD